MRTMRLVCIGCCLLRWILASILATGESEKCKVSTLITSCCSANQILLCRYGEDPYLGAVLATEYIQTMQERDEYGVRVATTIKHFLYGQSSGGVNTASETGGLNKIFNTVGVPYMKAIQDAQPLSLMTSYASYDHVPMAANQYLLQDILRKEMGFEGLIMSDALAIPWLYEHQRVADSLLGAGVAALKAGIQLELSPAQPAVFPLLRSTTNDTTIGGLIDQAVLAVLKIKFTTGEFDRPLPDVHTLDETLRSAKHLETCRTISEESVVLLQNDGVLPSNGTNRIAILGPFADIVNSGSYAAAISNSNMSGHALRQSLVTKLGSENVIYAKGVDILGTTNSSGIAEAVAAAKSAGIAVLMVGSLSVNSADPLYGKRTDGEFFSHAYLDLPGLQQQLVDAVIDSGAPTIVVLSGGQAFALGNSTMRANAIIHSFLGGEFTGDAVADIIMGDVTPSGKLPFSLPQANGAWPIAYNLQPGDYYGGSAGVGSYPRSDWQLPYLSRSPPMPFGFGLSYTSFSLSHPTATGRPGRVTVSAKLTNTGKRSGKEVVQLYFRKSFTTTVETANKQLIRFQKLTLDPGRSRNVTFTVDIEELGYYVNTMKVVESGLYQFWMGTSSRAEDLQALNVTLTK